MKQVLPYTDIIIGNEAEAEAWGAAVGLSVSTGSDEDVQQSLIAIAKNLATFEKKNSSRPRVVIITQGPKSTLLVSSAEPDSPKKFDVHALEDSLIIDTNGAGDAFAGGFIGALVAGKSIDESIETGHKLGAMSIQQVCTPVL